MMNIYLILAILATNIIAILAIYHFIKGLDKMKRIVFMAIAIATMYILILAIYGISGIGIDEKVHEATKDFVVYMFVPVNLILFVPYFASQYIKFTERKLKRTKFAEKIFKLIVLLIIVLIFEGIYFSQIQKNITLMNTQSEQNNKTNEIQQVLDTNIVNNQITANEVESSNTIKANNI